MWYFTWILGLGFACGILNAMWHEQHLPDHKIATEE